MGVITQESAATSEELSAQALQLKQMLGKFKLRKTGTQQAFRPAAGQSLDSAAWKRLTGVREGAASSSGNDLVNQGGKSEEVIRLDDTDFGKF